MMLKKTIMQSITQMYLKNEYLPINYGKKYGVRDFVLLNSAICNTSRYGSQVRGKCVCGVTRLIIFGLK